MEFCVGKMWRAVKAKWRVGHYLRVIILFIALFPEIAHAEVMDKEFSLVIMSVWGVLNVLLVYLAARNKPWLLFVLLPITGLFFVGHLTEVIGPSIGSAIAEEAGDLYIYISWVTPVLVVAGGCFGLILRYRNVKDHV